MTKKKASTAILDDPTASQDSQEQPDESITALSPSAAYSATHSALERTQQRLEELAENQRQRAQRTVEMAQHLTESRATARQAQEQLPVMQEALDRAKAMVLALADTPAAQRATVQVAEAEKALAQAKHSAAVTAAALEAAIAESAAQGTSLQHEQELDDVERSSLVPLIPHLQERAAECHRQMGVELLEEISAQIAAQHEKAQAAHEAASREDAALAELKTTAGQQLAAYPELALETQRLLPASGRPIVTVLEKQLEYLAALEKHVTQMSADAPILWNETPLYAFLAFDKEYTRQWLQGRSLENLAMRRRIAERYLTDVKQLIQFKAR